MISTSFLYSLTIYPLETLFKYGYEFCVLLTSSYGWGLICFSFIATILFSPFINLAQRIQVRERRIQEILSPQIGAIKKESTGRIRHERINALYRRYAYHPIYSLRSAFGVLLQMPFLFAAYAMLASYDPIAGHSFGPIEDLSRPDGLLGGLNLLPAVMTLFNLGALYTSEGFSRREHLQGLILAVFFFLLLYSAQSALLVYWTSNNALSLLQNIYKRLKLNRPSGAKSSSKSTFFKKAAAPPLPDAAAALPTSPGKEGKGLKLFVFILSTAVAGAFLLFPTLLTSLRDDWLSLLMAANGQHDLLSLLPDFLILLFLFLFSGLVLLSLARKGGPLKNLAAKGVILAAMIGAVAYFAYTDILSDANDFSFNGIYYYAFIYLTLLVNGIFLASTQGQATTLNLFQGRDRQVYFSSALTVGFLLIMFGPSALYSSSPDLFPETYFQIIRELLPYLACGFLCAALLWLLVPKGLSPFLSLGACVLAVWFLLNGLVFIRDFGPMQQGFTFASPDIFGHKWTNWAMDVGTLTLVAIIIGGQYLLGLTRGLVRGLNIITVALICFCLMVGLTDRQPDKSAKAEQTIDDRLFSFSPDQPNTLIIILDSFDARHLREILARDPGLEDRFDGFMFYEDTVANASCTILSVPSIYGGYAYTPEAYNQRPEVSRDDKTVEAMSVLPRAFSDRGYDVSLFGAQFKVGYEKVGSHMNHPESLSFIYQLPNSYLPQWRNKIGVKKTDQDKAFGNSNIIASPLIISLFRSAPNLAKEPLYKYGSLMNASSFFSSQLQENAMLDSAMLGLLPELAQPDSSRPTLKIIFSGLTHIPWYLPPKSLVPTQPESIVPDPSEELPSFYEDTERLQYYTERHALNMLADFNDWLKAKGIYENTQIILVSDHNDVNWGSTNADLNAALKKRDGSLNIGGTIFGDPLYIIRPEAILLVKELGSQGPLERSEALMTTADVPAIACATIGGCPGIEPFDSGPNRIRHHISGKWREEEHPKNTFEIKDYTIRGPMHDISNWSW